METKRVVVASNLPIYAKIIQEALELAGYGVINCNTADSIVEAFQVPEESRPVALICDILFGRGETFTEAETEGGYTTGIMLYRYLRERYQNLLIVLLTVNRSQISRLKESHHADKCFKVFYATDDAVSGASIARTLERALST